MALTFFPTIYSRRIIDNLDKMLVGEQICNRDYEGDAATLNTVRAFTPGPVTVVDYTKNVELGAAQIMTDTVTEISIDQQKAINMFLDRLDINKVPVNIQDAYMMRAIYSLRDTIDQFVLGKYVDVHANNKVTPSAAFTVSNVWDVFEEQYRKLDDSKVPPDFNGNYFAVVSPRVLGVIKSYLQSKGTPLGDQVALTGRVGEFCGFELFRSHNVPVTAENMGGTASNEVVHNILTGSRIGITLAKGIPLEGPGALEVNTNPEKRFGTLIKGLTVYGAKMFYTGLANGLIKAWFTS